MADAALRRPAPPPVAPLRDTILTGRFVGTRDLALEDTLSSFLVSDGGEAVERWFGSGVGLRLRLDPNALRGALDRDIAAIDATLSEQIDACCTTRSCAAWKVLARHRLAGGRPDQSSRLKIKTLNAGWPKSAATWNAPSSSTRATCSARFTRTSSARRAASRTACWWSTTRCVTARRPGPHRRRDGADRLWPAWRPRRSPHHAGASPALLEVDSFADLACVIDINAPLRNPDHARWRGLAAPGHALYRHRSAASAGPSALAGRRHAPRRLPLRRIRPTSEERVWMTAAYAFASVVARAFATYAWPADVRGVETDRVGGGLVDGLPLEPFRTDPGSPGPARRSRSSGTTTRNAPCWMPA